MKQNSYTKRLIKSCYFRFKNNGSGQSNSHNKINPTIKQSAANVPEMKPYSQIRNKSYHSHDRTIISLETNGNEILAYMREILLKKKQVKVEKQGPSQIFPVTHLQKNYKLNKNYVNHLKMTRKENRICKASYSDYGFLQPSNFDGKSLQKQVQKSYDTDEGKTFSNTLLKMELNLDLNSTIKSKIKHQMKEQVRKEIKNRGHRNRRKEHRLKVQGERKNQTIQEGHIRNDSNFTCKGWETEENEIDGVFILKAKN